MKSNMTKTIESAKQETYKPKTTFNKKFFAQLGVIFELEGAKERNSIVLCHWPHCGMNALTARRLAKWLLKRADDLDKRNGIL